jgi:hypothetical protein
MAGLIAASSIRSRTSPLDAHRTVRYGRARTRPLWSQRAGGMSSQEGYHVILAEGRFVSVAPSDSPPGVVGCCSSVAQLHHRYSLPTKRLSWNSHVLTWTLEI